MNNEYFVEGYKNRFIHEYNYGDKEINYCIGFRKEEPLIDEEEAGMFSLDEYQETLKRFGAKQFIHEFDYGDGFKLEVQDSYFDTIEQCKAAIDYLVNLEDEYDKNGDYNNKFYNKED